MGRTAGEEEPVGYAREVPLKVEHWAYKSEGGEHIILAYCGDEPALCRKVLRLKKRLTGKVQMDELEIHRVKKQRVVPLLGHRYAELGEPVKMNQSFLEELNRSISECRPKQRLHHQLDVELRHALLMNDLTLLVASDESESCTQNAAHTITIEVKPKSSCTTNGTRCRYCMHQHLKLRDGSIKAISDYCPLDFFSADEAKMRKAIHSLFACPQNNLKVYCNGLLYYTGELGGKTDDCEDSYVTLKEQAAALFPCSKDPMDVLMTMLLNILQQESALLENLKRMHSMDTLGIDAIHYLHQKLENKDVITNHLNGDMQARLDSLSEEEMEGFIQDYLIAAAAKDCSIMVTIKPMDQQTVPSNSNSKFSIIQIEQCCAAYWIAVVDVDPKSRQSIEGHQRLRQQIVSIYSATREKTM